jgi:methylglyoxal synthase
MQNTIAIDRTKKIALVAHDSKKDELFEWAKCNCRLLAEHSLYATGSTGCLLESGLGLNVTHLESGPLGGDQQIGSRIAEGQIDFVIFFSDPLEPQPHDADVKALLRIAVVWNIPVACNRASADFIISSPLMSTVYERQVPDYSKYRTRLAVRKDSLNTISPMATISDAEEIAGATVSSTAAYTVSRQVLRLGRLCVPGGKSRRARKQLDSVGRTAFAEAASLTSGSSKGL